MIIFFFQAEDGIRDLIVTGVQTCALPISGRRLFVGSSAGQDACVLAATGRIGTQGQAIWRMGRRREATDRSHRGPLLIRSRSEERRVGKECRYWWAREEYIDSKRDVIEMW